MGDEDPCNGACDGGLEVLGEPAASIEPSNRAFYQRPYNVAKSHSRRSVMVRMGRLEAEPER
jgi:hypothetical protein